MMSQSSKWHQKGRYLERVTISSFCEWVDTRESTQYESSGESESSVWEMLNNWEWKESRKWFKMTNIIAKRRQRGSWLTTTNLQFCFIIEPHRKMRTQLYSRALSTSDPIKGSWSPVAFICATFYALDVPFCGTCVVLTLQLPNIYPKRTTKAKDGT